ncbi:hypothetical protein Misp03_62390 [Microbispora sp. NBRC 16548]|nr:hypothetical protein Misp03_62390 [Microbispora sp. NBRC 16548]
MTHKAFRASAIMISAVRPSLTEPPPSLRIMRERYRRRPHESLGSLGAAGRPDGPAAADAADEAPRADDGASRGPAGS